MTKYTSLDDIDNLTREFRESIIQPDGRQTVKVDHYKFMQDVHFDIPNLDYNVLCELPKFLVRMTIFPGGNRYYNADQPHFLMWMAEICHFRWDFTYHDKWFTHYFRLLVNSHLAKWTVPSSLDRVIQDVLRDLHILAACYAFPFLERCIRTKCDKYVQEDGLVIKKFKIPRYGESDKSYTSGKHISNISHELKLLHRYVATSDLREMLDRFMNELNEDSGLRLNDVYELIGYWRNRLLHGEEIFGSGWDVATYLICIMLMSEITKDEYNSKLDELRDTIRFKQERGSHPFLWYRYKL